MRLSLRASLLRCCGGYPGLWVEFVIGGLLQLQEPRLKMWESAGFYVGLGFILRLVWPVATVICCLLTCSSRVDYRGNEKMKKQKRTRRNGEIETITYITIQYVLYKGAFLASLSSFYLR